MAFLVEPATVHLSHQDILAFGKMLLLPLLLLPPH